MAEPSRYRVPADARPADWVVRGLRGFGKSVLSIVPAGLEAYVRVFHPAYRGRRPAAGRLTWAEIAVANGRHASPAMQLCSIVGSHRHADYGQPGVFDEAPHTGTLPVELIEPLSAVLSHHTSAIEECWFGVWEGFGALPDWIRAAPAFEIPNRRYYLLRGPLAATSESVEEFPFDQSANLWWPDDRTWCVASEIDLNSTYVGTSEACADELLAAPGLETLRVDPSDGIAYDSDPYNPVAIDH
jgi:hypothetical protein